MVDKKVLLWCLLCWLLGFSATFAQSHNDVSRQPLPPKDERFVKTGGILIPWRESVCWVDQTPENSPCQRGVTAKLSSISTLLKLYDDKGVVWKTLDLSLRIDDFRKTNSEIVPFATSLADFGPPQHIYFRLVGESDSWYKAIVNEDAGQMAYAFKGNIREWVKSNFEYFFHRSPDVQFLADHPLLYDQPNGKPIDVPGFEDQIGATYVKLDRPDGEWMYVKYGGWIRWRDGAKLLVATIFSNDPYPE